MPNKPLRLCTYPGCNQLVASGRCEKHTKQEQQRYDRQRGSAADRGYDYRWAKFREIYMRSHPLCVMCQHEGYIIKADLIHHIKPLDQGGSKYDEDNLMSVCQMHHEELHKGERWRKRDGAVVRED